MMGIGVMLSVITRQNMWLLSIMTVVAMKNCRFSVIAQIAVWIRCVAAVILSGGSLIGIFDIGEKTKPFIDIVPVIIGKCLHQNIDCKICIKRDNADFFNVSIF